MKIENQVCNYEQAQRLKELGVVQDAYWCWAHKVQKLHQSFNGEVTEWEPEYLEEPTLDESSLAQFDGLPHASAFTVAELGEMLPKFDSLSEAGGFVHESAFDPSEKDGRGWYMIWEYDTDKYGMKRHLIDGHSEAEVRAAMLIYLLEQKLITPEQINNRLNPQR